MARRPRAKTKTRRGARPAETPHARRVRRYLEKHPGATKAEARGHRPDEHKTRKPRGTLTEREKAAVKRFAVSQARPRRLNADPDELYRAMLAKWDRPGGWDHFERWKTKTQWAARQKRQRDRVERLDRQGRVVTLRIQTEPIWDDMDDMADEFDIPAEWGYYH